MASYVYIQSGYADEGARLYTVGFYAPDGTWEPESDHADPELAAARCAYLNGGGDVVLHKDMAATLTAAQEAGTAAVLARRDAVNALRRIVEVADSNPSCSVGHVIEHVVPEARDLAQPMAIRVDPAKDKDLTVYTAMRVDRWGKATILYCGTDYSAAMEANHFDEMDEPAPDKAQAYRWKIVEDAFPSWKNPAQGEED
jgi:hypothetical protein